MNAIDASNVTICCQTLDFAKAAADRAAPMPGLAAHCYVQFRDLNRSAQHRLRNWAAFREMRYTGAGDGWPVRHAIRFGLDNFTGVQRGRAEAFAAYLQGRGIRCDVVEIAD